MGNEGAESWEKRPAGAETPQVAVPATAPPVAPRATPAPASTPAPPPAQQGPPATSRETPLPSQPQTPQATPATTRTVPKFDTYQATITRMETHHSGLWEFDFVLDKPMDFIAGQYVSLIVPEVKKPAPFSIASSPLDRERIVLGIEIVGEVTTAASQKKPGDVVTLKGPFGNFVMGDHEHRVCFLAGGIGITPFMSMLRWIRDTHPDKHAVLFYSCKAQDQFMWLDELQRMQVENDNIKIVLTCTKEKKEGFSEGRIAEEMIRRELPDFDEYVFFTCGPPGLIEAMFQLLEGMGVPKQNIRREAWH